MANSVEELVPAPKGCFEGTVRPHGVTEEFRGSVRIEYTPTTCGAKRPWETLKAQPNLLGAIAGNQAMHQVRVRKERSLGGLPTRSPHRLFRSRVDDKHKRSELDNGVARVDRSCSVSIASC